MKFKLALLLAFAAFVEGLARVAAPLPPARTFDAAPPGYTTAYTYKGALHLLNRHGERRSDAPIPPLGDRLRVAAVGDSYTLGFGVAEGEPWPEQLAAITGNEVLNFGRGGATSREVAELARGLFKDRHATAEVDGAQVELGRIIPAVDPDVLVYAVCVNDADPAPLFLPGLQRFRFASVGVLRLAGRASALSIEETAERYGDFERFEADVRSMREAAVGARFIAAVFDNLGYAGLRDRYEARLEAAGAEVVRFRLSAGSWVVAADEQHPNAAAHRAFAEVVARAL